VKRLLFSPEARRDLHDLRLYLAQDRPNTATRFVEHIEQRIRLLALAPRMGRERGDLGAGIRMLVVGPYLVLYLVDPRAVRVVRVIHGTRDLPDLFEGGP
jgi:toxin ParE1/3/4